MARVTVLPARDDLPRGGAQRAVAGLTAAITLFTLNRVLSQAGCTEGADPAKATTANEFLYCISGVINRFQATGDLFDFTGLTPVPPGWYQQYVLLVDKAGNGRVQEAIASADPAMVAFTNVAPNPYEAVVEMLNAEPNGWSAIGGLAIQVDPASLTPFTPGVDSLATGPLFAIRDFFDGFDGTILLPAVGSGAGQQLAGF
jgi:hypothetical protein